MGGLPDQSLMCSLASSDLARLPGQAGAAIKGETLQGRPAWPAPASCVMDDRI
jgi:hypothetical protein